MAKTQITYKQRPGREAKLATIAGVMLAPGQSIDLATVLGAAQLAALSASLEGNRFFEVSDGGEPEQDPDVRAENLRKQNASAREAVQSAQRSRRRESAPAGDAGAGDEGGDTMRLEAGAAPRPRTGGARK